MKMTTIKLKHSKALGKRPSVDVLAEGEVALNIHPTESGAYFKNTEGDLVKLGPTHVGEEPNFLGNGISGGESGHSVGETWFNPTTGEFFIRARSTNGNSQFWVQI